MITDEDDEEVRKDLSVTLVDNTTSNTHHTQMTSDIPSPNDQHPAEIR